MLPRLGNQARRSVKRVFVCTSCRQHQGISRATPQPFASPATVATVCATRQYSTANAAPADEPKPKPDDFKTEEPKTEGIAIGEISVAKQSENPRENAEAEGETKATRAQQWDETMTQHWDETMSILKDLQATSSSQEALKKDDLPVGESLAPSATSATPEPADEVRDALKTLLGKTGKTTTEKKSVRRVKAADQTSGRKVRATRRKSGDLASEPGNVHVFNPGNLITKAVHTGSQIKTPGLQYGLERVLFNAGVYDLQDNNSKVYNFDPYLSRIMPAEEFDFDALRQYVTSSKDTTLLNLTIKHHKKYTGSTSSMTSTLSHFHHLLSSHRPLNYEMLSHGFMQKAKISDRFTRMMHIPVGTFLHWKDGAYAIDADKEFDADTVLSKLGRSMEKLLTLKKDEYERYRKSTLNHSPSDPQDEAFNYTTLGDFLMRSQLDAQDARLPGTGMFDLKTRAVVSIRMDVHHYERGQDYEIRHRLGEWESYEREYYDMIRAAFLKYSLQVRMGRMNGIFVAFHNTQRIFGFQYIPLNEMDRAIHGTPNTTLGDREYKASVHLLNAVLDRATARFPKKTLRLFFETRDSTLPFMYIFAKPVTKKEVAAVQGQAQVQLEKLAKTLKGDAPSVKTDSPFPCVDHSDVKRSDLLNTIAERCATLLKSSPKTGSLFIKGRLKAAMINNGIFAVKYTPTTKQQHGKLVQALMDAVKPPQTASTKPEPDLDATAGSTGIAGFFSRMFSDYTSTASEPKKDGASGIEMARDLEDLFIKLVGQHQSGARHPAEGEVEQGALAHDPRLQKFDDVLAKVVEAHIEKPTEDAVASDSVADANAAEDNSQLFGMILSVKHKVNGEYVTRPENLKTTDSWVIEYSIKEMDHDHAIMRYQSLRKRRKDLFDSLRAKDDDAGAYLRQYRDNLRQLSKKGKAYRMLQTQKSMSRPVRIVDSMRSFDPKSVFGKSVKGEYASWTMNGPKKIWNPDQEALELEEDEIEPPETKKNTPKKNKPSKQVHEVEMEGDIVKDDAKPQEDRET